MDATGPDGKSIFNGKQVTGFCNTEEEAVGKTKLVPFLLEDRLKALGGKYEKKGDWSDFSIVDGRLITGDSSMTLFVWLPYMAGSLLSVTSPGRLFLCPSAVSVT